MVYMGDSWSFDESIKSETPRIQNVSYILAFSFYLTITSIHVMGRHGYMLLYLEDSVVFQF